MKTRNHVLILTNVLLITEDVHNCVSMNLEVTSANVKTGFIQPILSEYSTNDFFIDTRKYHSFRYFAMGERTIIVL